MPPLSLESPAMCAMRAKALSRSYSCDGAMWPCACTLCPSRPWRSCVKNPFFRFCLRSPLDSLLPPFPQVIIRFYVFSFAKKPPEQGLLFGRRRSCWNGRRLWCAFGLVEKILIIGYDSLGLSFGDAI